MKTVRYLFKSQALGAKETLEVIEFSGHEAISEPYEFVIDLKSSSAEIDAEAMLDSPCTFTMEIGEVSRTQRSLPRQNLISVTKLFRRE